MKKSLLRSAERFESCPASSTKLTLNTLSARGGAVPVAIALESSKREIEMADFLNEFNRVADLINRSETLLDWSRQLSQMFEEGLEQASDRHAYIMRGQTMLLVVQVNLYFQDALLCTNTVLFGDMSENKEEIGLPYLQQKFGGEIAQASKHFDSRLAQAQKKYKDSHLKQVRNKHVAHKDLLTSGDAITAFMNRIKGSFLNDLGDVIKTLKTLSLEFDIPINNVFEEFYRPAFNTLKQAITASP